MRTSEDYQEQAIRCLRLAQATDYRPSKVVLLDLAQQWAETAQQARLRQGEEAPISIVEDTTSQ